ncbi:MAG: hypothetical protein Q8M02_12770 [Candidatus Didemnitutus sp.]|nr:hypothetical protein [Candidatus Didemnitutus sp.]
MKTYPKIALSVLALGFAGLVAHTAFAQMHGGGEHQRDGENQRGQRMQMQKKKAMMGHVMAEYLGLSEDQRAQMKGLHEAQQAALVAVHSDQTLNIPQRREEAQAIHQSFEQQRQSILTPEQKTRADELRAKVQKRVQHRMKQHMGKLAQEETQHVLREFMQKRHGKGDQRGEHEGDHK